MNELRKFLVYHFLFTENTTINLLKYLKEFDKNILLNDGRFRSYLVISNEQRHSALLYLAEHAFSLSKNGFKV